MDFILDLAGCDRKAFQVDDAWFYLMIRDKEKVRNFPVEENVDSITMQRKSHISKKMVKFIYAASRPDPSATSMANYWPFWRGV